jgi:arylsulfatase A-like enzyme
VPTLLEIVGIREPVSVDGQIQKPIEGTHHGPHVRGGCVGRVEPPRV